MGALARSGTERAAPVGIDPATWRQLAGTRDRHAFCDGWIRIQAGVLPGGRRGLLLDLDAASGEFVTAAVWPDADTACEDLVQAAGEAIADRLPLVSKPRANAPAQRDEVLLAYPVIVDDTVRSVAAFAVRTPSEDALRDAMMRLQWGSGWLEVLYLRERALHGDVTIERLRTLLDLVAATVDQGRYNAACTALVTELASRLHCDRVSYGEYRGRRNRVKALSHSGQFGRQMNLISDIARAMDEAADQRVTVAYPVETPGEGVVTRCQEALVRQHGSGRVVTVPLFARNRCTGALCFEFPDSAVVDAATVDLCDTVGLLFAPLLDDKRGSNRSILAKNAIALRDGVGAVLGPRRLLLKLVVIAALAGGWFLYNTTGAYRVTADAVLEGAVQRVVAAPFDGYVAASYRRAGDRVAAGELLGEIDDRDLKLELIELTSERAQAAGQYREAQAAHERARTNIFRARMEQADARIRLVNEQIERTRLKAPFDGIVVSGDLSQSLGAAVERGEVLFEVAPLDDYRIILKVDERDVDYIRPGQQVSLVLSALPGERIESAVTKVTPVSTAASGRNYFRVEAHYQAPSARLRPGMEGVAKIGIDDRPLVWIWTRELVDFTRLALWRWLN